MVDPVEGVPFDDAVRRVTIPSTSDMLSGGRPRERRDAGASGEETGGELG